MLAESVNGTGITRRRRRVPALGAQSSSPFRTEDNAGHDEKIIAVPSPHLTRRYENVKNYTDVPIITLHQIEHFFEHYKDLEEGKWVKIGDWGDAAAARLAIVDAIARAEKKGATSG